MRHPEINKNLHKFVFERERDELSEDLGLLDVRYLIGGLRLKKVMKLISSYSL